MLAIFDAPASDRTVVRYRRNLVHAILIAVSGGDLVHIVIGAKTWWNLVYGGSRGHECKTPRTGGASGVSPQLAVMAWAATPTPTMKMVGTNK